MPILVYAADIIVLKDGLKEAIINRIDRLIETGPKCLKAGVRL